MSRLLVVTRPNLLTGFLLTGVDVFAVEDVESAQELIGGWLEEGEEGLLAIDEEFFAFMEPSFVQRLQASDRLPFLTIPGGQPLGQRISRKQRIAEMIRRAVGFHITFKGEEEEVSEA
jgi:vacuolar-type H+-ATPase subunit F/Vma7